RAGRSERALLAHARDLRGRRDVPSRGVVGRGTADREGRASTSVGARSIPERARDGTARVAVARRGGARVRRWVVGADEIRLDIAASRSTRSLNARGSGSILTAPIAARVLRHRRVTGHSRVRELRFPPQKAPLMYLSSRALTRTLSIGLVS